jgi:hypothetical protein
MAVFYIVTTFFVTAIKLRKNRSQKLSLDKNQHDQSKLLTPGANYLLDKKAQSLP